MTSAKTHTAVLVLDDGTVVYGTGLGATGTYEGEIVFNTAITGYQEVLTDPSYNGQIITFTFPHIGNVGANSEDIETNGKGAVGMIVRENITSPSNWRAVSHLDSFLKENDITGIAGIDTRQLTRRIRAKTLYGLIAHQPDGQFDLPALKEKAANIPPMEGQDMATAASRNDKETWTESTWELEEGYRAGSEEGPHIVALDFGVKHNILRHLSNTGAKVTCLPGSSKVEDILALKPDGVFLSNGPGDPAATGAYAVPTIQALVKENLPIFGICLGHQMLALALGAKTYKMPIGHRGANHPVQDLETGQVAITSQNHGFVVDEKTLPDNVKVTHRSLFDGSVEGIALKDAPVFSVQYHPEASPGPQDAVPLFNKFVDLVTKKGA